MNITNVEECRAKGTLKKEMNCVRDLNEKGLSDDNLIGYMGEYNTADIK